MYGDAGGQWPVASGLGARASDRNGKAGAADSVAAAAPGRWRGSRAGSMPELSLARQDHRNTMLVRGSDHLAVADGATWLNDGCYPGLGCLVHPIPEGEEGVRPERRALGLVPRSASLVDGEERRVHP